GGPISIMFASPVGTFEGFFTYQTQLTLTAFDAGHNSLGSVLSAFSNNDALFGDPFSTPNERLQFISAALGIGSVTIAGDSAGNSFVLDDVTFAPQLQAVPELGTLFLIGSGLFVAG